MKPVRVFNCGLSIANDPDPDKGITIPFTILDGPDRGVRRVPG